MFLVVKELITFEVAVLVVIFKVLKHLEVFIVWKVWGFEIWRLRLRNVKLFDYFWLCKQWRNPWVFRSEARVVWVDNLSRRLWGRAGRKRIFFRSKGLLNCSGFPVDNLLYVNFFLLGRSDCLLLFNWWVILHSGVLLQALDPSHVINLKLRAVINRSMLPPPCFYCWLFLLGRHEVFFFDHLLYWGSLLSFGRGRFDLAATHILFVW